ncbi:MAG TPA: peptide chain release factor 2, partial [Burkholderiales bacterium]|nr:peptide chain release factor 2 [Burkholderiales bacterium]
MEAERLNQLASSLSDLEKRSAELRRYLDLEGKQRRLAEVEKQLADPGVWNDQKRAQELGREKKTLDSTVGTLSGIDLGLKDAKELFDMARAENDDGTLLSVSSDVEKISRGIEDLEFRRMFNNPLDPNSCFMDIQAGAGGTEAQDWASMLERMYIKYCDKKGFKVEELERSDGEVAGLKSATLKITGDYAYGNLRTENGVHRLVRKSPFDSNARRHTSFANVFVYPEVDDSIEVEINPADLRVDVYRASGAGGQHVNKTESAVRIIHKPSGIVVACQSERSQHKNRSSAMKMLRARLFEKQEDEKRAKIEGHHADKKAIEWGSQIRSYVLAPYRLVTDHRTDLKVGN